MSFKRRTATGRRTRRKVTGRKWRITRLTSHRSVGLLWMSSTLNFSLNLNLNLNINRSISHRRVGLIRCTYPPRARRGSRARLTLSLTSWSTRFARRGSRSTKGCSWSMRSGTNFRLFLFWPALWTLHNSWAFCLSSRGRCSSLSCRSTLRSRRRSRWSSK